MAEDDLEYGLALLGEAVGRGADGIAATADGGPEARLRIVRSLRALEAMGLAEVIETRAGVVGAQLTCEGLVRGRGIADRSGAPSRVPGDVTDVVIVHEGGLDGERGGDDAAPVPRRPWGEGADSPAFRISTSPPDEWDGDPSECGHYCDLHAIDDGRDFAVVRDTPDPNVHHFAAEGTAWHLVRDALSDREIGLLARIADPDRGFVYVGIDHLGWGSFEPAANEALWDVANEARDLADGHRLARRGRADDARSPS